MKHFINYLKSFSIFFLVALAGFLPLYFKNSPRKKYINFPGLAVLCGLCAVFAPFSVQAKENLWRLCTTPIKTFPLKTSSAKIASKEVSDTAVSKEMIFTADEFEVLGSQYQLKGKVEGGRGNQRLSSDSLSYNKNTDLAEAVGNVRFEHGERILTGDSATINLGVNSGNLKSARYWFPYKHIRGQADSIEFKGVAETRLKDAIFTTCDEGSNDWLLKASSLRLDTENNEGVARHARISFFSVPIFYFPYLSFPLEGRKSGFLAPSFGDSTNSGTEISVPYYWNIAPHRDATVTPRYLSRRGLLLETEFRYLNQRSYGQIDIAHINDDRIFGEDRTSVSVQHQGSPSDGWRTQLDYSHVSDEDYLDDFGSELAASSVTQLERFAYIDYRNQYFQTSLLVQNYQTLDKTLTFSDKPYRRLPQLQLKSFDWKGPAGFEFGFDAEAVRFDRSEGVIGSRLDLQPRVSWPWHGQSGFVIPKLVFRHTQYQLSRSDPAFDDNPSRNLPIFSLDSGLYFEREIGANSYASRQSLEPRLFYLHVPYQDQDNLIVDELSTDRVFDSSVPLFSFSQMFRDNRFSGGDRIGDASQLGAGLTTRFFDYRGRELLSASVGRTFYFRDRKVTLPGEIAETDTFSDWVAEIRSHWTPTMSARASVQWDTNTGEMERGSAQILYKKGNRRALKLAYRFEENAIEQSDIAFIWPLANHWGLVGRWLHSIRDDVTLETLKGIEYDSCCWTARLVQRSYRVDALDEKENNSIWIQLELKGLTSIGKGIKNLLARDIISY